MEVDSELDPGLVLCLLPHSIWRARKMRSNPKGALNMKVPATMCPDRSSTAEPLGHGVLTTPEETGSGGGRFLLVLSVTTSLGLFQPAGWVP